VLLSGRVSLQVCLFLVNVNLGMCDRLIEDIVAVTETLMVSDAIDIEAFAHPDAKLTVNDKIDRSNAGLESHAGVARLDKVKNLRQALADHQAGEGVFKRGSC
jgi:hypothetical protein